MQKYLVVFLWTHCSWKSSYARAMIDYSKCKEIVVPSPKSDWWNYKLTVWKDIFALWHYHAQCWWVDWFWPISKSKQWILDLSQRDEKVMVIEWVLMVTAPIFQTILNASIRSGRKVIISYLWVSEQEARKRLYKRNWWKQVWDSIVTKKRYYDKRIVDLKRDFEWCWFQFIDINTEKISPEEWAKKIRETFIK